MTSQDMTSCEVMSHDFLLKANTTGVVGGISSLDLISVYEIKLILRSSRYPESCMARVAFSKNMH